MHKANVRYRGIIPGLLVLRCNVFVAAAGFLDPTDLIEILDLLNAPLMILLANPQI